MHGILGWLVQSLGEPIIKREPQDLADEVKAMLELGSLNLYMFHGGTNFGFIMVALRVIRKSTANYQL